MLLVSTTKSRTGWKYANRTRNYANILAFALNFAAGQLNRIYCWK